MAFSNSKLVSYTKISPNRTVNRNHSIDTITIHCMAGNLSIESCGSLFADSSREASSNYGVGTDGRIGLYVEEKDRSWCTSDSSNDHRAVTIEVANTQSVEPFNVSDKAMKALIKLCADICHRNNIKKLIWHADKSLIGQVNKQNMTVHRWFANKSCPGNYLYSKHSYIAEEVNKLLSVPYNAADYTVTGNTSVVTADEYTNCEYIDPTSLVDASKIYPYIATLDESLRKVDVAKLKKNKVVGVMMYAGSYYDSTHSVKSKYVANNLKLQAAALDNGELPYGLIATCRAKNQAEAKKECEALWYIISKYPPKLGVWIKLDTTVSSKSIISNILNMYYKYLVQWGLKDKCGLYATKQTMKRVDWNAFQDNFYLWLVDRVSSVSNFDDTLLTPEFFDYE